MRIGIVGPLAPDYFADNLGDALTRTGHSVTQLGPARAQQGSRLMSRLSMLARQALPRLDEQAQSGIVRRARDASCEIVISVDAHLMPSTVGRLQQRGTRVALWFPDHVANLGRQTMLLAPYDALFFKEPHIVDRLRANLGLPVYYLPQACNPRWHRPLTPVATEPCLVVAGNMYPSRVGLLDRLIDKGIPLRLYGSGFPRWMGKTPSRRMHAGHPVVREEKARVFRSAVGVLNTMQPAELMGVNSRLFEAAGSGAAVLTEYRPTVADHFVIGEEVLTFNDFDQLLDQATRLLNEDGLSARLGNAATRRAHRDHTIDLRIATLLEKIA